MSVEDRLEKLEQLDNTLEQDTIIPEFQNPDTCVFCDDKAYDNFIFAFLRVYYNIKNGTEYEKLDKEICIHHKDKWLKHSYRTGGFIRTAFREHCKNSTTNKEIIELFGNKEQRERLLTESYDRQKKFNCACHLYLYVPPEVAKHRYSNAFTIEDDIPVQNKIIQNKLKTHYTNAIEVLQAFDEEAQ